MRGQAIFEVPVASEAKLALVVNLVPLEQKIERLPEPQFVEILGESIPLLELHAFEASAAIKLLLALHRVAP